MKIFVHLAIIFIICMTGDAISSLLPFTFPGSIIAMLLLFGLFCLKLLSPEKLDPTGSWLQRNMAFFFLPSNILIMKEFELISHFWMQILIICVVSTIATFAAAAGAASAVMKIQEVVGKKKATPSLESEVNTNEEIQEETNGSIE